MWSALVLCSYLTGFVSKEIIIHLFFKKKNQKKLVSYSFDLKKPVPADVIGQILRGGKIIKKKKKSNQTLTLYVVEL